MASRKKGGKNNRRNDDPDGPSTSGSGANMDMDLPTGRSSSLIVMRKQQQKVNDIYPKKGRSSRESKQKANPTPPKHVKDEVECIDLESMDDGEGVASSVSESSGTRRREGVPYSPDAETYGFSPHWSYEALEKALLEGKQVFTATFHVNAHNRLEAYCKIDGVPKDVFIGGVIAQNRAVEGDIVAVHVESYLLWTEMKELNGAHSNIAAIQERFNVVDEEGNSIDRPDYNVINDVSEICMLIDLHPSKRPTGTVVSIIKRSPLRQRIVGMLNVKQWASLKEKSKKDGKKNENSAFKHEYIQLMPTDPKFPPIYLLVKELPWIINDLLDSGDETIGMDLFAAKIDYWLQESPSPKGTYLECFGRGDEVRPQLDAILFQNAVCFSEFPSEALSCLPSVPWELPEIHNRKDLRDLCIFTIDPSTATDLESALSVERLSNTKFRVGIHITDVSYFVLPGTGLDKEALSRSTSVHMSQRKSPMLPALITQNIGSLNPGVDRFTVSMLLDINSFGAVEERWIGRAVIRSCCKLSYEHVQDIIDKSFDLSSNCYEDFYPEVHGCFKWTDIISSLKLLYRISYVLNCKRFCEGTLRLPLENPKIVILFNENAVPYDTVFSEQKEASFLVKEFMLLANTSAAEVIYNAYPDAALLRRHPEPNMQKLKEFAAFCQKRGFELNTSTLGRFQWSLDLLKEKLKGDPVLYDILISYAMRPVQLPSYFCSGDLKDNQYECGDNVFYLYTHWTSPFCRYPDIVVHRAILAIIEAEETYNSHHNTMENRCFTGIRFDEKAAESVEGREALSAAASRHGVASAEVLADIAAYYNQRELVRRNVKDACDRLYMWLLVKTKNVLLSKARVLELGPTFMSIYIEKLATERRIYYDKVEGLAAEWLEATSSVVLSMSTNKHPSRRDNAIEWKAFEEVVLLTSPFAMDNSNQSDGKDVDDITSAMARQHVSMDDTSETKTNDTSKSEIAPGVFPLKVHLLSSIPVAIHAVGGDDGPIGFGVRLYMRSYFWRYY